MTNTIHPGDGPQMAPSAGPLADLTVVDLTRALAGPHAAMMLGDLGAEVIKVENPGGGDDTRGWGPPFIEPAGAERESTYFLSANRNKKSITLDLKAPTGREALAELLRRADVLMENFRPGVLDRLGFSEEVLQELNPRLIILSISGFGHDGPEAGRAGYDQIAQGEAGLMSLTGANPHDLQRVGVPIADLLAGMYGAFGVLAALNERARTGRGQVVRASLLAAVVGVHAFQGAKWTVAGQIGEATGNHHPSICPYGLFDTADGAVQIAVGSEGLWKRFCEGFHLDEHAPGLATNPERVANQKHVNDLVQSVFSLYGTDELLDILDDIGVPAGRIRNLREVYEWEQTRSQGLLIDVDHETLGTITLPGPPLRFFEIGGPERTRRNHTAPPVLGADNHLIDELTAGRR
ncbi:CaiB/BaiF CoA transferase family protein [Mycolicibacterium goodii]|uniref:CaiB/BaiF CoA transferase family protein n=1 Tax=Mycolicibacterium goodii TaxID=134601 RepID=UPI001FEF234E|nr:CoA transferase [Mycolicibacterium goodii]ULN49718.1 CoA transferase [Mycolicibacterium goodii]